MKTQIETLQLTREQWLDRNDLGTDTRFYSREESAGRREEVLEGAQLVLIFEGGLFHLVNYDSADPLYDEFEDTVGGFGYYFELGQAWSMGFYPLEVAGISVPETPRGAS